MEHNFVTKKSCAKIFRKTKEYSSLYFPNLNKIRRDKSYIYEEFLQSDGFDVKVYTIGKDYAHAEERKSPTLDGKVNRSIEGKEVRYPINLTEEEKDIVRRGRNTQNHHLPKNAEPSDYMYATAFEGLIGYLYLMNKEDRIKELLV